MKRRDAIDLPGTSQLETELRRVRHSKRFKTVVRNTLFTLITVAAVAVLVSTLLMPVLRIYGDSMRPTLDDGQIIVAMKPGKYKTGDVLAFYYNNKIIVKRVIANPGDWVDIDKDGNVYVNSVLIDEPYVINKSLGECNIELPYQVPESRLFVMGDHRDVSIDSRNTEVGCIAEENIVGKIIFRVWPFSEFGTVE